MSRCPAAGQGPRTQVFEELRTWEDYGRLARWWRDDVANVRLQATTKQRPIDRFEQERAHPRLLPPVSFDTDEALSAAVSPHAWGHYDGNCSSAPLALASKKVLLRVNPTEVRVFYEGRELTRHDHSYQKGQWVVHPDHRLAALKMRRRR